MGIFFRRKTRNVPTATPIEFYNSKRVTKIVLRISFRRRRYGGRGARRGVIMSSMHDGTRHIVSSRSASEGHAMPHHVITPCRACATPTLD